MVTKQEYIDALNRMVEVYDNLDGCISAINIFNEGVHLLEGLVNEHFEEKQETNFEHFFEYLSTIKMCDLALIGGRVAQCLDTPCRECDFNGDCIEGKFKWLKQPYKKPVYKFTKFENDLLQSYLKGCLSEHTFKSVVTLRVMKEKGYFKGVDENATIKDILADCEVIKDVNG